MTTLVPIASVKPWWLRALLFTLFASPMLTKGSLHGTLHAQHPFADLLQWIGYCVFLWVFICLCAGLDRLLDWLAFAAVFGLSLAFGGAFIQKVGIWNLLQGILAPFQSATPVSTAQHELDLIFRLVMTMASLPFFMLVLYSFPAGDLFARAIVSLRGGSVRRGRLYVSAAVMLRMVQHVFELFGALLIAWKEENPVQFLPRLRADMQGSFLGYVKLFPWAKQSLWVWCQALLVHSLLFVPVAVRDWQELSDLAELEGVSP